MNMTDFVYSASSPLTIGHHTRTSVSPSSGSSKQNLANAEQIQDLRAAAFTELQQSIQSYNDSFVMTMRYQESQERLYKQQQLGQSSTSWTPAMCGNMDGGNYNNRCFGRRSIRIENQQYDWNDNTMAAYHHFNNEYSYYDDNMDDRSMAGSSLVPSQGASGIDDLTAFFQRGTIQ